MQLYGSTMKGIAAVGGLASLAALVHAGMIRHDDIDGTSDLTHTKPVDLAGAPGEDVLQVIDGFGGSFAFWGYNPSDEVLDLLINDLGVTIIRTQGDLPMSSYAVGADGPPDAMPDTTRYQAVLTTAKSIAAASGQDLQVILSFWQPRSEVDLDRSSWLYLAEDPFDPAEQVYALRGERWDDWAAEITARTQLIKDDWGINVTKISIQNEPNFSRPGTPTCYWGPATLSNFITDEVFTHLTDAGVQVGILAPEPAYVGVDAFQITSYPSLISNPRVSGVNFHLYDSYGDGQPDPGFYGGNDSLHSRLEDFYAAVEAMAPGQSLWMTETSGAQWNSAEWHTLGWSEGMSPIDKAIAAATHIHESLVTANASVFLWWGLTYAYPSEAILDIVAPPAAERPYVAEKFSDEGLVLVDHLQDPMPIWDDGVNSGITKKYYAFKQYSRYIRPGYKRVPIAPSPPLLVSSFRSPGDSTAVVVIVNPEDAPHTVTIPGLDSFELCSVYRTDSTLNCEPILVAWTGAVPGKSITTLIYQLACPPDCNGNGIPDEYEPDADGDGVIDDCDDCPDTLAGTYVDETGCPAPRPGDFDGDGDVDLEDFAAFQRCQGSDPPPECLNAFDHDGDGDVDLDNWENLEPNFDGPTPICGNGIVTAGEECDDGNLIDGDGCDLNCTTTTCGNGIVTAGEECDDGNLIDGDGCSATCTSETPSDMVLVSAGEFQMGDTFNEGYSGELPVHTVWVSAFYIGRYEVTKGLWDTVRTWATSNGYDFIAGSGKAADHPVHNVTWYDCVKWCNARSQQEGRMPCYYTDAGLTAVYRTGEVAPYVKWDANGYRLPTEAEWEKAARGGVAGHRFPWSDTDTIQHARANYYSNSSYSYDTSSTRGDHPTFNTGGSPYTSPVGFFAPNGYGLHDMAGNVLEWCHDWLGSDYSDPEATQPDPDGPASGYARVVRGGVWAPFPYGCRSALRFGFLPDNRGGLIGFRCALGTP